LSDCGPKKDRKDQTDKAIDYFNQPASDAPDPTYTVCWINRGRVIPWRLVWKVIDGLAV